MKFSFIFTALLIVLADAENAEGMRDCSRESQGGVGAHTIFQSDIGHIFFQPLWSETSNEFGMDFWTIMHILTLIPLLKMRFETFDEFRALFKCQGKQTQLLSSWEYISENVLHRSDPEIEQQTLVLVPDAFVSEMGEVHWKRGLGQVSVLCEKE